ncbi:hypothetical protein HDV04_006184 [Boothiomyces sp. JEL0838]|nr:hypothetical protein HDV04_006184 [Boothiomyces sp. JEL0838]
MGKSLLVTLGIAQEQIVQTYVPDGSRTVEIDGGGNYLHNAISTGKYSFVSFVPKFTLEFFSKYANMFFLFISCIQPIGDLSPTSKVATAGPLAGIFIITALKEMWEDRKRHAQDNAVNNSVCKVLRGNKFVETLWKDVKVGDIVRVENGQNFPSDLVIISTSEPDSLCYIETSNLDGETNLKIRQGLPETGHMLSPEAVAKLQGTIETELPNNSLYTFKATLRFAGQELAVGPNQLLLRGAQLRNTKWIYGLVVFTGHETKLMKNSTATPIKSTKVDSMVNSQVILLFVFLVLLAVGCAVGELYMEKSTNFVQDILSPVDGFAPTTPFQFFEHVMTFMILFNNLIPLSLMISLEFVKLVLGMYINQDLDMYYDEKDMPATAKTTTLVEELGQVDFIFSDKTGTLTRNIMEFKKFSVGGNAYTLTEWPTQTEKGYYNKTHFEAHKSNPEYSVLKDFLSLLSVCHTVIPEVEENSDKIIYQASSPDETRRPKSVTMSADGVNKEYQILHVNEFNSTRKRMSLVVRGPDGKVKLMIKGAETVILERLGSGCPFKEATMQHMEEYANEGLRTLVYAYRDIDEAEYQEWRHIYERAATSITNREEMLDQAAELIEKGLNLVGATAIEDKLQEGVPETIYNLLEAGIRMWVLTGDRQDTAINIGISCKLLNPQMEMIVCNKETKEETKTFLADALNDVRKRLSTKYTRPSKWKQFWRGIHVKDAKFDKDYGVGVEPMALVIDGNTLTHALDPEISDIFLEVALLCKSVICCRVSPLQKALVVKLVKNNVAGAVTLAIGDGANDVSMIQSANVGVGISGQEGLQAARSADFAIGQFRYLRKLLLVHGGWAYSRISKVILISFYKNLALYLIQCWFSTSEPDSLCYIETSNLDGETNLKIRQGLPETGHMLSPEAVAGLKGTIETELPNNSLYTFKATLRANGKELAIGPNQLLLRGAQLRNTKWAYGLVVFTGHETKLMKNSTATPIKSTKVDSMVNSQVVLLFVFLILLAVGCAVGELYMEKSTNFVQDILSPAGKFSPTTPLDFFQHVLTFMILFNNLIPLSLMISLEFVKLVLGMYINQDLDMYYDEKDMPATAKTTTLVEELGQIDFIFSDKTGTLTRNIMEFRKISAGGYAYSDSREIDSSKGYYHFSHLEQHLRTKERGKILDEFLSLLSVCHTVIPERDEANPSKIIYQASSPDEVALVDGAKQLGYTFHTRRPKSVTVNVNGVDREYQIYQVNEFNSTRKRMSLVVRGPDGKIKLMIKGAETVIVERLAKGCTFLENTTQHMEEYANEGLRTLVYAYREIGENEYQRWRTAYEKAATSITNREEMLDQAAEMIEKDLQLLGATAIEDKLQDGVPETIHNLLEAGIRLWVLTGDRQDTAINIGISCRLLNSQMEMIVCNKETKEETKQFLMKELQNAKKRLNYQYTRPSKWKQYWRGINGKTAKFDKDYGVGVEPMALVIDGNTLTHALDPEISDIFLEVALLCKSVICCRVSPLQKALVVKLVKNNVAGAVTLAIGDGANDVSMIQSANVGVGISGQEGLQAARSADFAIGQFRYLRKLLLVHGGWAYSRISKVILISFYKNLALYLIQCWFTLSNFFSGMTLFETWSGVSSYNVAWTLLPPIAIGIFDQYISAQVLFKYPRMYRNGQDDRFYNHYTFILWILNAIFHSLLLFYGWVYILGDSDILANGLVSDNWVFGIFVYVTALTTVMIKHCLIIDLFNGWTLFSIFGSLFAYYILLPIYCLNDLGPKLISKELFNVNPAVFGSVTFFLSLIFLPFAINLRDFAWKFYKRFFAPQSYHIIQEIQKHNIPDYSVQAQWFHTTVSKIQKMKEMNLGYGYAFSQNDQQLENKVVALYDTTKRKPHG